MVPVKLPGAEADLSCYEQLLVELKTRGGVTPLMKAAEANSEICAALLRGGPSRRVGRRRRHSRLGAGRLGRMGGCKI